MKLGTVASAARDWLPDALMVAGAGAVSSGAWLIYEPAGFIVGGAFLLGFGWIVSNVEDVVRRGD